MTTRVIKTPVNAGWELSAEMDPLAQPAHCHPASGSKHIEKLNYVLGCSPLFNGV
jgi:hypothetical protein